MAKSHDHEDDHSQEMEELQRLLEEVASPDGGEASEIEEPLQGGAEAHLRKYLERYNQAHRFQVGQLVEWKDGLKNRKSPKRGQKAIVIQHMETPIISKEDESGSPYFREPLDLVLGLIDEDDDFMLYHFDSHRFQPVAP